MASQDRGKAFVKQKQDAYRKARIARKQEEATLEHYRREITPEPDATGSGGQGFGLFDSRDIPK